MNKLATAILVAPFVAISAAAAASSNSATTLEDVVAHYRKFFSFASPKPTDAMPIVLTPQDEADIVAFLKLL
jgi:hypothetical protein